MRAHTCTHSRTHAEAEAETHRCRERERHAHTHTHTHIDILVCKRKFLLLRVKNGHRVLIKGTWDGNLNIKLRQNNVSSNR
jgi:hypothetical protein